MITSKQRAYLRGLANYQNAIFQIGKGDINENFLKQVEDALEARELIKISVHETSSFSAREACGEVCKRVGAEPVSVIGRKFIIYKESQNNKSIML